LRTTGFLATFLRWPLIPRILLIISSVIIIFGSSIHVIEPTSFPTIFDGIWWAIITTSTIGYGDFVPTSILGRSIAILLILIGTGFVTTYFVALASSAVTNQNAYLEGKTSYQGKGHVVIVGWNERVKETIKQLKTKKPPIDIILIDETLEELPNPSQNIHFIKGNPMDDETLEKANITNAELILITSDQSKDETQADMCTILTLLAVKGLNPDIYSICELLTSQQVNNAKRAGAEEILQTNKLSSYVMVNSVLSHGMTDALLTMLDQLKGSKLKYINTYHDLVGKSFGESSNILQQKKTLLLGVKRGNEAIVNPAHSFIIMKNDQLLVIKN